MKTRLRGPERAELMRRLLSSGPERVESRRPSRGLAWRLTGWWQELEAAGIGGLHAQRDLPEAELGELLAVAQLVDVDGGKEGHDRLGLAQAHHLPEVRHEIEVAEPCEQRPPVATKRDAVEAGVGDRHRLHDDRLVVAPELRHAEQGAAERQHARAVAAGAFGKQHQIVAGVEPPKHLIAARADLARGALDEDRALRLGKRLEERPGRDLGL